jgi:hypothetical protein
VLGQVDGRVAGAASDVERLTGRQGAVALDQLLQALGERVSVPGDEAKSVERFEEQLP